LRCQKKSIEYKNNSLDVFKSKFEHKLSKYYKMVQEFNKIAKHLGRNIVLKTFVDEI